MADLDDLLADIDDPERVEQIKGLFDAQQKEMQKRDALMARDAKVRTEQAKLAQKFPRAMHLFSKSKLRLPDDPSDEALVSFLKDKESELEDFVLPGATVDSQEAPSAEDDPAGIWGSDISTGRGDTNVQSTSQQFLDAATSGEHNARLEAIGHLSKLNHEAEQSGDYSTLDMLATRLGAQYPVTKGPPATFANLQPIHGAGGVAAQKASAKKSARSKAK